MHEKMGNGAYGAGFFCLFAMLLLTVVETCGTNAGIYRELQEANGLPEAAGISQEEMERLDGMLADYLPATGRALDDSPFNERELAHMRDVLALFDLAAHGAQRAAGCGGRAAGRGTLAFAGQAFAGHVFDRPGRAACAAGGLCGLGGGRFFFGVHLLPRGAFYQ